MKDLETIKITNQEGKEIEIKAITILKKPDDGKSFLLYTFDSESENVDVYASILKEENAETMNMRLMLSACTVKVIESGMSLLGIEMPEKM